MAKEQDSPPSARLAELYCKLLASEEIEPDLAALPEFDDVKQLVHLQQALQLSANISWLNSTVPEWKETLPTVKIQDILMELWLHGRSGYLLCKAEGRMKILLFSKGSFHSARSNVQEEQVLAGLLKAGSLSEEAIGRAQEKAKSSGLPLYAVLMMEGSIQAGQLLGAAENNFQDIAFELLSWDEGEVSFYSKDELEDVFVPLESNLLDLARYGQRKLLREQSFLLKQLEMDLLVKSGFLELSADVENIMLYIKGRELEVLKAVGKGVGCKDFLSLAPADNAQEREQFFAAFAALRALNLIQEVEALSKRKVKFLAEEFSDAEVHDMYDDLLGTAKRDEILKSAVEATRVDETSGVTAEPMTEETSQVVSFDFDLRLTLMAFAGLILCLIQSKYPGDMVYGGADISFVVRRVFLAIFGFVGFFMCSEGAFDGLWKAFKGLGWKAKPFDLILAVALGAGCSWYTFNAYAVDFPWFAIAWVPLVVLGEELFFRSYLFSMFEKLTESPLAACFFCAVLNSFYFLSFYFITEQDLMRQLFRFGVSFITLSLPVSLCYLKSRSILVSSFFHATLRVVVLSRNF